MGAVGTQAHLIFPRRILPGRSWTPPLEDVVGPSNAEGCTELASLLEKWRRASDNGTQASVLQTRNDESSRQEQANSTVQQDRRCGAQAPMAAVASLIQQFEGRAMHPELQQIAEQEHKEQPSDVEKPHTPPKRETPLMPLQRESGTEDEEAGSPVSPLVQSPSGIEDLNSILMASILESKGGQPTSWKDSMHDAELPGKLPAYWPAACLDSSMDSLPRDISVSPDAAPLIHRHTCEPDNDNDSPRADSQGAEGAAAGAGKQHLKTYAELLSEETAAMKNAVGPWQPRLEKSSKLMEFQDTSERLRRVYKRLQPLREAELTDGAEACQAALSLTADATAASHTEAEADAEASQLCFNGGQVVGKTPEWVMDVQQAPLTLVISSAARQAQDSVSASTEHAEREFDTAEACVRRLMARTAVEALAEASQRSASSGVAATATEQLQEQRSPVAGKKRPAMLQSAGYVAWAGLEDGIDISARVCTAALQTLPVIGPRLAAAEPDLAAEGPTLPVRVLRRGIKLMYGTAGGMLGFGEGILSLAKQL